MNRRRMQKYWSTFFALQSAIGWSLSTALGQPTDPPQWRRLENAPARPSGVRHDDVFFIDESRGWICNLAGEVFGTTDGGYLWTPLVSTAEAFRSIAFLDSNRGFLGSVFDVNLLFETSDGGASWDVVDKVPQPRPTGICGLWPASDEVIYGVGKFSGPAVLIKSDDAGATWQSFDLSSYASSLVDVYFTDPDSGFVVGGIGSFPTQTQSVVLSTSDGGASWQERWRGAANHEWGWKISFPTPNVGYVSLESGNGTHRFLKSTDGGLNWVVMNFGLGASFREQGVGFATPELGWMGGSSSVARSTTNGGLTWTLGDWGESLNRVFMLNEELGFAVGRYVWKYSRDAFPTSAPPDAVIGVELLEQNQPNPFNPTTVIPYYMSADGHVRIVVYDPKGRHMATLVDELRRFGEHRVVWNGRDQLGNEVASGIYYYRLESGSFSEVRKMTMIR